MTTAKHISDPDKVDAHLTGLDYPIVTWIFDLLHVCVQSNQTDPDTENPPRNPLPISVWVCMCLFLYTLRIPSGQEAGFWKGELEEQREMDSDYFLIALSFDTV